ncbi:MAG TPA: UDP-3-O-(3-hydroxymyristoyl)glucosamine N-acyltransferase [Firmicutes bacterium]|nr:UDP-3-O-(3-hydroxymyristoyl)glucosamine N-acyltransferase [Bacillota bacterium]
MPGFTLGELAKELGARLRGPADLRVRAVMSWEEAGEGSITLATTSRIAEAVARSPASAVLVGPELAGRVGDKPALVVDRPRLAFARLLSLFSSRPEPAPGVHPTAVIGKGVHLGEAVSIGPYAVIEDGAWLDDGVVVGAGAYVGAKARIGQGSRLGPHVVVYDGVILGRRVVLQAGAVVGSEGFGYERVDGPGAPGGTGEGAIVHLPHIGTVVLEDDVEVGANACIDRATCGVTRIGRGTKIDNLVQIAHNVTVGPGSLIAGQSGIAGSAQLGAGVTLAGQTGVVDHARLGDGATVAARGVVVGETPGGRLLSGFPAHDHTEERRVMAATRRLPALLEEVRELRRRVEQLEKAGRNEPPV